MAAIVLAVIIGLAILLGAGELQNKADPTTTTYTPRPDWYFYFLFELLRVIKPPSLVVAGDGRHPDARDGPAGAAAVLRPESGAPPGAAPDRDHAGARHDRDHGLPDLPRRARRGARQDQPGCAGLAGGGAAGRQPVGLRRLPQVRRGRKRRARGRI